MARRAQVASCRPKPRLLTLEAPYRNKDNNERMMMTDKGNTDINNGNDDGDDGDTGKDSMNIIEAVITMLVITTIVITTIAIRQ